MSAGWIFQLSDRQHWELARGTALQIALPYPTTEPSDWIVWAQSALPDVAPIVRQAQPETITIRVPLKIGSDLTHILGQIYPGLVPDSALSQRVLVIVVLVCQNDEPTVVRGPRWPKSAFRVTQSTIRFGGKSNGT